MAIELQWDIPVPVGMEGLEKLLRRVADACFEAEGVSGAGFCVRIVDDEQIQALNLDMRGIDSPTDVLSFPTVAYPEGKTARDCPRRVSREYDPAMDCANLGDCVINLGRARAQAEEYGHSLQRELGYLTAHSAFHLMGYDHMNEEEKTVMRNMEERALSAVGITREGGRPPMSSSLRWPARPCRTATAPIPTSRWGPASSPRTGGPSRAATLKTPPTARRSAPNAAPLHARWPQDTAASRLLP